MRSERGSGPETAALCGFRGCQEPLPPPGPRGGRPFEFCPDREWPGGRTCKQLAAADQALRDALGESLSTAELRATVDEFGRAAEAIGQPLATIRASLTSVAHRVGEEVTATATRAEAAEARAAEAEGLRQTADARADAAEVETRRHQEARAAAEARAEEATQQAVARVEQARTQVAEADRRAEASREQADDARKEAEVVKAGAAAMRASAERQAADAAQETRRERERADALQAALAERGEQLSVRTAERDAAKEAFVHLRTSAAANEQRLRVQLDQEQAGRRQLDEQLRGMLREHREHLADAARELDVARDQAARLTAKVAEAEHREHTHTEQYAHLQRKLTNVQRLVLDQDHGGEELRTRLLGELLSLPAASAGNST